MRHGFTTGSCAAAASKAAAYMLLTGHRKNQITIETPGGISYTAEIIDIHIGEHCASCAVVKDGGDDPDVTTGMKIYSKVSLTEEADGKCAVLHIDGGEGIGRVTRPGLDQPVGAAAVNSVPRKMILEAVGSVCAAAEYPGGLAVTISAPEGAEVAKKTFNADLGIQGGISILGTSGIVEPMSQQALIDTITLELRQRFAQGHRRVILTPAGRDFYPKAKQLTALYQEAVRHARAVQQQENPPERHLVIAWSHEAMRMFGYDLFSLTNELCLQYTSIMMQCASRSEVWRSLKKGDADLSFQLESAEFYAQGFTFIPLLYVPELCIPIHPPADMPVGRLSLEQALQYRWLPIKEMYQTVYETSLLQEGMDRGVEFTPVGGIRSAAYGDPALKMVPAVYYRRPDLSFVRVLDWGRGHRFGIVLGQKREDPVVMAYVRALQRQLPSLAEKLFGLKLEPVAE